MWPPCLTREPPIKTRSEAKNNRANKEIINKISKYFNVPTENITIITGKKSREKKAIELMKSVDMEHRADHKPTELSGGQQQRVSICRSLINNPDIILADEPTGALDSKSGLEIMKIFTDLKNKNKTIIMVTHTAEVAKYADRIIFMRDGKVMDKNYELVSNY